MERRQFGRTDMQVSVLGFGGAEIGFEGASVAEVREILAAALDAGLNVIDTAECYMNSEELIGDAVGDRRNDFYLFTKCGHKANFAGDAWSGKEITESIDRSLKRLKTDHVDLVQLHSCDAAVLKAGDAIEALKKAKESGKTRYIGYSGDGQDAVFALNTGAFDALQTSVSIADQEAIDLLLPIARKQDMGVIAKRPIANASWRHASMPDNTYVQPYWQRLKELKYDFINGNPELSAEMALRFTLSVQGVHTMIVGTRRIGRWLQNAQTVSKGRLATSDFDAIRDRWKSIAKADWIGQV